MPVQIAQVVTVDHLRAACRAACVTFGGTGMCDGTSSRPLTSFARLKLVHHVVKVLTDCEEGKQDGGL